MVELRRDAVRARSFPWRSAANDVTEVIGVADEVRLSGLMCLLQYEP